MLGGELRSENCAAATGRPEVFLDLGFLEGAPGVDNAEDILALAVVCGRHSVSLLATAAVDDFKSLLDGALGRLVPHNIHRVKAAHGEGLLGRGAGELNWVRAGRVGHEGSDLSSAVWMSLFVQGHAPELMWGDVAAEPLVDLLSESVPVAVASVDERGVAGLAKLRGEPGGLAAGVADVLGCARDANHVDGALGLQGGQPLELLVPLLLVVEGVKLEVDEGGIARDDRLFAVEESQDVVAFLDVGLVGRDGKYLTAGELLLADPRLHAAGVRQSVPTLDDLGGGVCRRPRLPSSCHFNFKLLNDR